LDAHDAPGNTALKYSCEFAFDVAQCKAAGNRAQLSKWLITIAMTTS